MKVHKIPTSRVRYRVLFSSFIGWMFDGFETSTLILVGSSAIISFVPNASSDEVRVSLGAVLSATLVGWAIGGVIGSILADYVGRKKMLLISIAGYSALTAITSLSYSIQTLITLRVATGVFLGSEWSTGTALVAETWPESSRAKALGFMQSGYGFGFLLASVLWLCVQPLGSEAWRLMFLIGILPAGFLIYIRREVDDSELWKSAASERHFRLDVRRFTVLELLSQKEHRLRIVVTLVMTSVTVSVFYAISGLTGPYVGTLAIQEGLSSYRWMSFSAIIYNIGAIIGYISAGFLADIFGRKTYMLGTFFGAIVTGALIYVVPSSLAVALFTVFLLGIFTLGVFSWMPIYLPELFPTRLRATASGLVFNLGRLVAFPLPTLTAFLFTEFGGYQAIVSILCMFYIVPIVAMRLLPETKGIKLSF